MKAIFSLLAIIALSVVALQATPHIKVQSSSVSSRIESSEPQKPIETPPIEKEPVSQPIQQPEPVSEKPVSDTPPVAVGDCRLAYNYDWPQNIAYAVCMAESSGGHAMYNGNDNHGKCVGSYGLFQIACFWFPYYGYDISYDPQVNVQIAYNIWKRQGGFGAWTTYTSGKYLRYM